MDALPPTLPPWPLPEPPPPAPPPPPREPAWSGLELTLIVLFTLAAMVVVSVFAILVWALATRVAGLASLRNIPTLVGLSLIGQTGGYVLGFAFVWLWVAQGHGRRFWAAIHWRKLSSSGVGWALVGGVALMVGVQLLGHVVPMPTNTPETRLFTPQTAWMLAVFGVVAAPFFEEFFFRGLLFPTLQATFTDGMQPEELRAWRPLARVGGALALLAVAVILVRLRVLTGIHAGAWIALLAGGVMFLTVPQVPILAVGWVLNQIAKLQRGEALAIVVTGILFGMMHAVQLGWAWGPVVILTLVGIVLTLVRARSGSLIPSWLIHCTYNATLFAAQFASTQGFRHFPH
ncbi:MAG: lysostaphin resistance A-like protein [Terriglobales bacterium]